MQRSGLGQGAALLAASAALLGLAGCCRQYTGAALVVNLTDAPLEVHTSDGDPVQIGASDAQIVTGPIEGLARYELRRPGEAAPLDTLQIELRAQDIAMVSPHGCAALVDYTAQYQPGGGPVRVVAVAGEGQVGRVPPADFRLVRGPATPLPEDVTTGTAVIRLTRVPCRLLAHPDRLVDHVARMD